MFELSAPWWELPMRVVFVYGALLLLVRLSGKRTLGQSTPFDLLVILLLSETVSSSLSGGEESVVGGVLAAATLIGLNAVVAFLSARSATLRSALEGHATLIGREGTLYIDVLNRHLVTMQDVERALRAADCDLPDMKYAFLEADGDISVLKKASGSVQPAAQAQPCSETD